MSVSSGGVLAAGTLYVNEIVAGVYQGEKRWPGVAKFAIKPNSDLIESTSKERDSYGSIDSSIAIPKPADFSVQVNRITGASLAMSLQGSYQSMAQSAGTLTSVPLVAHKGTYLQIGFQNIVSTGFSVKDAADTVTYVLGTDYTVDWVTGTIYIVPTGAIADAATTHVNGTYHAISGTRVLGGTVPQVRGQLRLDAKNLDDGRPLWIWVWDARLTADGEVDFMSDKMITLALKGRMVKPDDKPSAFYLDYDMDLATA